MEEVNGVTVTKNEVAADWLWFPVPTDNGYELHPAWHVSVEGTEEGGHPVMLSGYVDATNGELLYRTNKIETATDITVKGTVYSTNTVTPATLEPLGNLKVVLNSTTGNLDGNGFISNASNNVTADFILEGRWSKVIIANGGGTPSNTGVVFTGGGAQQHTFTAISEAVNAYYHTNRVHDFMKPYFPGFNSMDNALTTNVELTTSTCNAFYNGSSINFYKAGGGCPSFAEVGDVVYHEYGHGINDKFYTFHGSVNFSNGAMGEGNADVWGMSITKDSILGRNTKGSPGSFIRRYDINPKVYPKDIVGEVHADGEIIAGAWWDYGQNVGSYTEMTDLFASTYYDLPNAANGLEGQLYHDVLISALLNDDDDATLSNGTPHFDEIVKAFAKHGIYLLADAVVNHTEINHQPANTDINVTATLTLTNPDYFQSLKLIYRNRNNAAWDTLTMVDNAGTYSATIPGQPMSSLIDYYFHVYDFMAIPTVSYPINFYADLALAKQSNIPYQFAVGVHVVEKTTFEDGPQTDWTIGDPNDDATSGKWIQVKPTATFTQNNMVQTGADHTTGSGQCMVTGNATGSSSNTADVDGGKTTLFSPVLNLTNYVYPIIEYYRWFSNDRGSTRKVDPWVVQIKTTAGIANYNIENTLQADYTWRRRIFALYQFLPVNFGVQIRFLATDNATGNQTIEAAVDDFFIYDGVPTSVNDATGPSKASVYPNPADDRIQVALGTAAKGTMTLYDVTGRAVASYNLDGTGSNYELNTSQFAPGQYMLIIQTENKTIQSQKVVISHQ
jgi:hypothetical protein